MRPLLCIYDDNGQSQNEKETKEIFFEGFSDQRRPTGHIWGQRVQFHLPCSKSCHTGEKIGLFVLFFFKNKIIMTIIMHCLFLVILCSSFYEDLVSSQVYQGRNITRKFSLNVLCECPNLFLKSAKTYF